MRKLTSSALALFLILSLAACQTGSKSIEQQPQKSTDTPSSHQPTVTPALPAEALPVEITMELTLEGMSQKERAQLTKGALNYQVYVLDRFRLVSEEPGKDILMSDIDDECFVRIERLDPSVQISSYKEQLITSLQPTGKVHDLNPEELFEEFFHNSPFYLLFEPTDQTTNLIYLAKTIENETYLYTFHIPLKESTEGITPRLWAMLKTLNPNN